MKETMKTTSGLSRMLLMRTACSLRLPIIQTSGRGFVDLNQKISSDTGFALTFDIESAWM
jgi:hypothetical protein